MSFELPKSYDRWGRVIEGRCPCSELQGHHVHGYSYHCPQCQMAEGGWPIIECETVVCIPLHQNPFTRQRCAGSFTYVQVTLQPQFLYGTAA